MDKTQKEIYLEYIDEEIKKGLLDINFSFTDNAKKATEEELNCIKDALVISDSKLF